jgi:capsule polysaccharide export protein KpsC/LpsZ
MQTDKDISALESIWRSMADCSWEDREYAGQNLFEICRASIARRLKISPTSIQHHAGEKATRQCIDEFTRDAIRSLLLYRRLFEQWRPAIILHFSGRFHRDRCAAIVAKEFGIPIVAIESTFHESYLYWDVAGRTGTTDQIGRAGQVVRSDDLQVRVDTLMAESLGCPIDKLSEITHRKPSKQISGKKTILFLGQVPYDASIAEEGGDFGDQITSIRIVSTLLRPFAHELIVRSHPKAPEVGLDDRLPDVCIVQPSESSKLLDMIVSADCVVTVCSQAGLQAAWLGKPVVLLGRAFYANKGFTFDALGQTQFAPEAMSLALDRPTRNCERQRSFYRYMAYLSETCMLCSDNSTRAAELLEIICKRTRI